MASKGLMGQLQLLLKGSKLRRLSPEFNSGDVTVRSQQMDQTIAKKHTELVKAFNKRRCPKEGMNIFKSMMHPILYVDAPILATVLRSFAKVYKPKVCYQIQTVTVKLGLDTDERLEMPLIEFYGNQNQLVQCHLIFQTKLARPIGMWDLMIKLHVDKDEFYGSIVLFYVLTRLGFPKPNDFILATIISCIPFDSFETLLMVHSYIKMSGSFSPTVASNLMSAYASFGALKYALEIINESKPMGLNLYWWNCVLRVYAIHGMYDKAFRTFDEMIQSGQKPNQVTILTLLDVCDHTGRIYPAIELYFGMLKNYGVQETENHISCLVTGLCRSRNYELAALLISSGKSKEPDKLWRRMAIMCNLNYDLRIGFWAFKKVSTLNADDWRTLADLHFKNEDYFASWEAWEKHRQMRRHKYIGTSYTC